VFIITTAVSNQKIIEDRAWIYVIKHKIHCWSRLNNMNYDVEIVL